MRKIRIFLGWLRAGSIGGQKGQAATEYMIVIAVLVVAMVAASRPFVGSHGPFQTAMKNLSHNIGSAIASPDSDLLPSP